MSSTPELRPTHPPRPPCDLRCGCGSLVARLVNGRIEIKCRRCRRTVRIALAALDAEGGLFDAKVVDGIEPP